MALEIPDINKTIPVGCQPEDFGQVGTCDIDKIFVVSALTSPLYISTEFNQYVLFIVGDLGVTKIKWILKFKSDLEKPDDPYNILNELDDVFVYTFKSFNDIAEEGELLLEIIITHLEGESKILLNQRLNVSFIIENLESEYIAFSGNKTLTSKLINNYSAYINSAVESGHSILGNHENISQLILASYLYYSISPFFSDFSLSIDFDLKQSIGICNIYPALIELIFENPTDADKINLLRFPKSNILVLCHLFSEIKNRYEEYKNLDSEAFLLNPEGIIFISQSLINTTFPNYLNEYQSLDDVLSSLDSIRKSESNSIASNSKFKFGRKVYTTTGTPWCRTFFYGEKEINGGIYDESKNQISLGSDDKVRVDVYWEIDKISQSMIEKTNNEYSKDFRIRVTYDKGLKVFNQPVISPESSLGNENIRLQEWQVFQLIEIKEVVNETGDKVEWYKIQYKADVEKWIEGFSVNRYATFEKIVKLNYQITPLADDNGKFSFHVYDPGIYFLRTIKETRYNDGVKRDFYDGEYGWFLAGHSKSELAVIMKSESPRAKWVKESDILTICEEFDENWIYDNGNGHYLKTIPNAGILDSHNVSAGASKRTDCVSFVESCIMYAWQDKYPGELNITYEQHRDWVNSRSPADWGAPEWDFSERLELVLQPTIDLNIAKKIYRTDKNQADIQFPSNSDDFDNFIPEPWSQVQYFNNNYDSAVVYDDNGNIISIPALKGHHIFILDVQQDLENEDNFYLLILESNSTTAKYTTEPPNVEANSSPEKKGVQIHELLHIALLNDFMLNDNFLVSRNWTKHKKVIKWNDYKDKNSIGISKLFVYDLNISRPSQNLRKIL